MAKFFITWCLAIASVATGVAGARSVPKLDQNEWWGPPELMMNTEELQQRKCIRPWSLTISQDEIDYLRWRLLDHHSFAPALEDSNFEYGFNPDQLDDWAQYWANEYNFTRAEQVLNQYPQYKVNVQGLDIHFIWIKPEVPKGVKTVPLLMLHGWPSSVRAYHDSIPILTTPNKGLAFEVIIPSLPGFGFSDAAVRPGLGPAQMAVVFKNLMKTLGHKKFYVQGEDWGAVIGRQLATLYQNDILGFHSTQLSILSNCEEIKTFLAGYIAILQVELQQFNRTATTELLEETGFMHLQATKPDSVGVGLSDSPIGLCAWMLEKFSTWTRRDNRLLVDGGLLNHFTRDQLLDNVMVYWLSNSMTSAMRIYAEYFSNAQRALGIEQIPTKVPVWNIRPIHELLPSAQNEIKFPNFVGTTILDAGHFVFFEQPEAVAKDIFKAVKAFRSYRKW
ncbi:juvenile hormone epoxide hydrolase-like [Bicyclus anynana]|uniref:Epoxide hydrolase n=1 Tax=Bicyclus anynana TaxID=110368 RepID=A0A6J1MY74_BICAN|nr:juvenile hormone epoxide hydrolase-like [Bicyclus anynana]